MPDYYMPSYPLLGIDEAREGMEGAAIDRVEFVTFDDDPEQDYFCLTLSTGLSVYGSAPSVYGPHPEHAFYSPHVVTRKDAPTALATLFAEGQRVPDLDNDDLRDLAEIVLEAVADRVGYPVAIVAETESTVPVSIPAPSNVPAENYGCTHLDDRTED